MLHRKIWVKRAGASPTMVSIREDDLVDDVRDMILKKYANSLGRSFDSPDVILRIVSRAESQRDQVKERMLGPEEEMCRTLDAYYPGGQTVDEALIIDVPQRRTPRPSPRAFHQMPTGYSALDDYRGRSRLQREHRPKYQRQHTSSPTIIMSQQPSHASNAGAVAANPPNLAALQHLTHRNSARPRLESTASDHSSIPAAPPLPTPPAPEAPPTGKGAGGSTPPTPNGPPPHRPSRGRKTRKPTPTNGTSPSELKATTPNPSLPSSLLDGSVPPINVLIVEDNLINLRLLEAFMKRLKVRWSTAMNGQIAVNKWRAGGFHLVLMDIQLPIMSGLEATKEIRRLERVNGIGVFSSSTPASPEAKNGASESLNGAIGEDGADGEQANGEESAAEKKNDPSDDKLSMEEGLFKSPVIIVALTASSLQSDRHEALAAGCNDFLTKPVNFVWLERKVKEWGCMQALIDFDGWRKWRDFASDANVKNKSASGVGEKKDAKGDKLAELAAKKAKREKRVSADAQGLARSWLWSRGWGMLLRDRRRRRRRRRRDNAGRRWRR
ncbi:Two-component response regulator SSK1p [Taxawa tesnikishii (nom. ined.)]|nr:Two-component response regulator SSK1p [Dothideales sp. JES 119]